jgi:hypothetical protein
LLAVQDDNGKVGVDGKLNVRNAWMATTDSEKLNVMAAKNKM